MNSKSSLLASEIEFDHFQIGDDHRWFCGRLFVIVVPLASQTFGFVPNFNQLFVVLNDNCILVEFAFGVRFGPASVVDDGEPEIVATRFRLDVNAIVLTELALGEDQTGKRSVEGQLNFHVILGAHDFQILNLWHVGRPFLLPWLLSDSVLTLARL